METVPCGCGCGAPAPIATKNSTRYGWVKGQPKRFVQGHHNRLRSRPLEELFWLKVAKGTPDDCWDWIAGIYSVSGYGQFQGAGAHRVAWVLTHGPIPAGMFVCHSCDRKTCVNPSHLFLGTPADNSADMVTKGRARSSGRGERNPNARLNDDAVRSIRSRVAAGESQASLAREFGVGQAQLNRIVHGKRWRHVL